MRSTHPIVKLICCCVAGGGVFLARSADPAGAPAAITNAPARAPFPPLPKPQVTYFRELLALSPGELDRALASIAEPGRDRLRAKLREYAALTPEEREMRLRATELRWHLAPLMRTPPTNRIAQLALIPDDYRPLVEERLKRWDALTPEIQSEVRDNEWTIRVIGQLRTAPASQRLSLTNDLTLAQREKLERQLASWLALPYDQRQRMCDRFEQFFELSPKEKERILSALSDGERAEMDRTLQTFEKLPSEQRGLCVRSFRKFANMTPEERAQFLMNAERWKEIPRDDRQTLRTLAIQLPPLPPRFQRRDSGSATPSLPGAPGNPTNAAQ